MNFAEEISLGKLLEKSNKDIASDIFSKIKNMQMSQYLAADIKKDKELVGVLDKLLSESNDLEQIASFLVQDQSSNEEEKDRLEIISLVMIMIYCESKNT